MKSPHILVVGLNHRTAPLDLRERLAVPLNAMPEALTTLRNRVGASEAVILSTCNRVELYTAVDALNGTFERMTRFLSDRARLDPGALAPHLYRREAPQSIRHLFAVTSGLDSMVLGEAEILGQVKQAYERAQTHGTVGKLFHAMFQRALNAAKAVRSQTGIGLGASSVGTVAVELAEKIFGSLTGTTTLLVGAGKIGELALTHLGARGAREVRVVNRSFERAQRVSACGRASPHPLSTLADHLVVADIVICSTSASNYLLRRAPVAAAMRARAQRPLCLIDLGVPRNIEPAVDALENVYRFDLDDLQAFAAQAQAARQHAVAKAEAIIDRKVAHCLTRLTAEVAPCIPWSLGPAEAA